MSRIIIIGGGLSGTLSALNLVRFGSEETEIIQIEKKTTRMYKGVAYSSRMDFQPLNVQASRMSVFPELPNHFVEWINKNKGYYPEELEDFNPDSFVKRSIYGEYLRQTFEKESKASKVKYQSIEGEAIDVSLTNNKPTIELKSGTIVQGDYLILALGNFPPGDIPIRNPDFYKTGFYESNPWAEGMLDRITENSNVLMLGSGLTMIDLAINLCQRGHRGTIHVLSRRGLLPRKHEVSGDFSIDSESIKELNSLNEIYSFIRNQIKIAETEGVGWRSVVDALRPYTADLWRKLSIEDKQQFLRHLRPYWEVCRHRIPEHSERIVLKMIKSGKMILHAGRIIEIKPLSPNSVQVIYRQRIDREIVSILASKVINCTGPQTDFRQLSSNIIGQMLQKGLAVQDTMRMGIKVGKSGNVQVKSGAYSKTIFAIGPIRKGSDWETTALREIRTQANEICKLIIENKAAKLAELTSSFQLNINQ